MTIIVPNAGEEAFLDLILAVNYDLKLFTNDVTLDVDYPDGLVTADFTEATFTGYAAKSLTGGSWTSTPADPSTGTYAQQEFERTSTGAQQTIYGYYVVTTTGGNLRWYELFPTPIVVEFSGDLIRITPRITLADTLD